MLSGAGGFVLGLLFLGAGLLISFRARKGEEPAGSEAHTVGDGALLAELWGGSAPEASLSLWVSRVLERQTHCPRFSGWRHEEPGLWARDGLTRTGFGCRSWGPWRSRPCGH